jgi:hypothetical protein
MTAAVPSMVRFVRQSGHHGDCSVVTLAMLAGVLYEDALAAIVAQEPTVLQTGLYWPQMRQAAKRLGLKTRLLRTYDIEEATGILKLTEEGSKEEHYAFLWAGRVIDGNGDLWLDPADFLRHYNFKPRQLLRTVD